MNYFGSYRKLLGNARSAIVAAIEIYNKPAFEYRDECFVILLLNAWELLLKAVLSKNHQSIYYPKKRKEPYRTLSWRGALQRAEQYFPRELPPRAIRRNIELLGTYRDNAVHFYNAPDFGVLIYALAQTSIKNFRDLLDGVFDIQLEEDISWQLLPLGIRPPIDPIAYIAAEKKGPKVAQSAVRQYLSELSRAVEELEDSGDDTGRLLTVFSLKLESVKKIDRANLVVGVDSAGQTEGLLAIVRVQDPNVTHPLRAGDVVDRVGDLHGTRFTSYTFQAVAWQFDIKENRQYCWRAKEGVLTRYSHDTVAFIRRLTKAQLESALAGYRDHIRAGRQPHKRWA